MLFYWHYLVNLLGLLNNTEMPGFLSDTICMTCYVIIGRINIHF